MQWLASVGEPPSVRPKTIVQKRVTPARIARLVRVRKVLPRGARVTSIPCSFVIVQVAPQVVPSKEHFSQMLFDTISS